MPREPRHHQIDKSLVFHVINRGILKQTFFHDDQDYQTFLELVKRSTVKTGVSVYHWCLMPNHYHVVMELPDPSALSRVVGEWQQVVIPG